MVGDNAVSSDKTRAVAQAGSRPTTVGVDEVGGVSEQAGNNDSENQTMVM